MLFITRVIIMSLCNKVILLYNIKQQQLTKIPYMPYKVYSFIDHIGYIALYILYGL